MQVGPVKRRHGNVWSAVRLQAKNDQWQLVCGIVYADIEEIFLLVEEKKAVLRAEAIERASRD